MIEAMKLMDEVVNRPAAIEVIEAPTVAEALSTADTSPSIAVPSNATHADKEVGVVSKSDRYHV